MNFLIFALLIVPTVYSLSVIPEEAITKEELERPYGRIKSATIDVEKAKKNNRFPQHSNIVEDFLSSSTDVDGNGQPDNRQIPYVEPIIGPVNPWNPNNAGKPLIPNQFIQRVWDHQKGVIKFVKIDADQVKQHLESPFTVPYPVIVDDAKEGVVVESNNRKKRQAILYKTTLEKEHPNFAEDYIRKSTDLNRNGQPDVTEKKVVLPYVLPTYSVLPYVLPTYGVLPYPYGAGVRYWY